MLEISRELGKAALERLEAINVEPHHPAELIGEAWRITEEHGWAKTYDAEYLALARLRGCRLVTLDGPLWRRTRHLGFVVTPDELMHADPHQSTIPDDAEPPAGGRTAE